MTRCIANVFLIGENDMAMNKKEAAELAAAKKAVIVARALNWSEPVLPDVPVPKGSVETTGYLYNDHSHCVIYARSSSLYHATSWDRMPAKTTSQGSRSLYSTKLLALRALRHAMEKRFADELAEVDIQIQQELCHE